MSYDDWYRALILEYAIDNEPLTKTNYELVELYKIYRSFDKERKRIKERVKTNKMTKEQIEGDNLVNRAMSVILSCRTLDQLGVAVAYSNRVYHQIDKTIGLINNLSFVNRIERSIGFAQCQIKHLQ